MRNGYLGLLSKQGLDQGQLGRVITDTEAWLKAHPDDTNVRCAFIGLLESKPGCGEKLQLFMREVESWLKRHPKDNYTRTRYNSLKNSMSLQQPRTWSNGLNLDDLGLKWPGE